ncbi:MULTISPECIES: DUF4194 domain-containing protein [Brucella]|uniref:DUF4194 domain-containing protein n=1 Tax=Brucella inopinata TaxID=1218315 RepID=A0AAW7BBI2_9HYPH|nr:MULTISPECIES: DUF4194 domain-containing protein [Brucella]MDL2334378.1 DUF4194 domain-containing protein [Brucella inopinata]QPN28805.1 DUF4194 domain-containing protein [Brucella sp. BO2]QTN99339.1 DUF4194 domain-containing protein [Brucella sp. 458]
MLLEFATLEENNFRDFERVTQLIGHLMRDQFVHAEDRGSATLLETLHRPKLKALVEGYFEVAGYRLMYREAEGWAGILPDSERMSLPRMRIDETVVLLVLRRLWEEALQLGSIEDKGTVRTSLNETYAAYQEIVAGTRRAGLAPGAFREVLEMLEKRALVWLGVFDTEEQDMALDIRALVATVAGDDFVASLEALLSGAVTIPQEEGAPVIGEAAS